MPIEIRESFVPDPPPALASRASRFQANRKIIAFLVAAVLLVSIAVAISIFSFIHSEESATARRHTTDQIANATELLSILKDADAGQRDYLLTGNFAFLQPSLVARARASGLLKELNGSTVNDAARKKLDAVTPLVDQKLKELAGTAELRRNREASAVIAGVNGGYGKQLMEAIRADLDAYIQVEQAELARQRRENQSSLRNLFGAVVFTSVLTLLLSVAGGFFIYRNAKQRVDQLMISETQDLLKIQQETNRQLWQANLRLKKNREQLRAFIQHAPVSIAMFDKGMNYLAASDGWLADRGLVNADIIGRNHYELLPNMPAAWKDLHKLGLAGEALKNNEEKWVQSDGSICWLRWALQPWFDENGAIGGIIIAVEDISESKIAHLRLHESGRRLQGLVDSAMDAIITVDDQLCVVLFNPAATKMFGVPFSEALGQSINRFIPDRFRETHLDRIRAFGQDGRPLHSFNTPGQIFGLRANGEEFPAEASISQIEIDGKKLYTVIVRDITARKRAENALREREAFNSAILDSVTAEIAVLNCEGTVIAVNQSWSRCAEQNNPSGRPVPNTGIGTNYLSACNIVDDMASEAFRGIQGVLNGQLNSFNFVYPCDSPGQKRWFNMSVTPLGIPGAGVVVAHSEKTASVQAEAALQLSHEKLRELVAYQQRIKEDERIRIAREIHDELGSALTAIKANLSVAMDQFEQCGCASNPRLLDASVLLDSAVETVRRVITDLRPSVLDNLGVWAALEWYAGQTEARTGISCHFTIDSSLEDSVIGTARSTELFRIFQETLTNVIRHAMASQVEIRVLREDDAIKMEVEDNGLGIDEELTRDRKSWGIAGMVERARSVGGNIRIANTSHGTLVTLRMPLEKKYG